MSLQIHNMHMFVPALGIVTALLLKWNEIIMSPQQRQWKLSCLTMALDWTCCLPEPPLGHLRMEFFQHYIAEQRAINTKQDGSSAVENPPFALQQPRDRRLLESFNVRT